MHPRQLVRIAVEPLHGSPRCFEAVARLDTPIDVEYYRNGGILQTVLRGFLSQG
jgi:aconitate hydratase